MVAFDHRGRVASDRHRFDNVRIECALSQKSGPAGSPRRGFKHLDKRAPDNLAFPLRINHPLELAQEQSGSVLITQLEFEMASENFPHHPSLPPSQHAIID